VRFWTAAAGIIVALFLVFVQSFGPGTTNRGASLFSVLTGYAFGLTLLAGVFLTADSLSEEKREGTLGLLFLTDLRGYDIVLGKLLATSLNAVYGLMALVPAMGLALLLGGVTGGEFWRVAVSLLNALFVSLSLSMAVSAFLRNAQRAMGNALALVVLVFALLPFLDQMLTGFNLGPLAGRLSWLSPFSSFRYARASVYGAAPDRFAWSLATSHLVGWLALALASWRLPRFAREEGGIRDSAKVQTAANLRPTGSTKTRRDRNRTELLARSPVLWLISNEPATTWLVWALVLAWTGTVLVGSWLAGLGEATGSGTQSIGIWLLQGSQLCGFLLKMLVAVQSCRFFLHARQNGALEMLASTPLTDRDVLKGQWLSLKRMFLWPLLLFWLSIFVPGLLSFVIGLGGRGGGPEHWLLGYGFGGVMAAWYLLTFVADVVTVALVGMWLSLTMRKPNFAPALTILLVLVLPSLLCGLGVVVDLVLSLVAYNRLKQGFRYALNW